MEVAIAQADSFIKDNPVGMNGYKTSPSHSRA
jgi:hypothetical protein